ncbi:MAG: Gfo/Idh/MocA family oxidoreductase [Planctomycetota bacterium]
MSVSRRDFLKNTAIATTAISAGALAESLVARGAHVAGSDELKVGLIGCGYRGTGAARQSLKSSKGVRLVAMGDLFADRLQASRERLAKYGKGYSVTDDHCFTGFDAYQKVIASGVDLVILATPPGFRPEHLAAAVAAGKHVFMEKPVAVCPAGIRSILASSELAGQKGLGIVAGTQRRHQSSYLEIMQRIHDGALGRILTARVYWNQGGLWNRGRKPGQSDVEWQIRNWLYFTWLSGDHIVEQHVHNIDVMNWALGSTPVAARGMGGRQVRTGPEYGHIYDHFTVEYEYPDGVHTTSMCRQIDGAEIRVGEIIVGTEGTSDPDHWIKGKQAFSFDREKRNAPYVQEHADLIQSIREGRPLNEGKRIAKSTLTAIMGRMATYTGQRVTWDFALESKLDLLPGALEFGDLQVAAVAMPGRTPLI